jgi:CPA2 family monovalent cation:H+ antiporter-2
MGLFFVSVGLMLDLRVVIAHWAEVLAILGALLLGKFLIIALLAGLFTQSWAVVVRVGAGLAQAGEFGFVLLALALGNHLLGDEQYQTLLAAMVLSMLASPLLFMAGMRASRGLEGGAWMEQARGVHEIAARAFGIQKHVILCGYGRSGQSLARLLESEHIPFIALDHDPRRVQAASQAGDAVVFGDSTRDEVLMAAGVHRARAVVVSFANTAAALKIITAVQRLKPEAPVIVRTVDDNDLDKLRDAGASEVVPEIMEGALMLGSQTMLMAGIPLARVLKRIRQTREARYGAMRGYFRGLTDESEDESGGERLISVVLDARYAVVGRRLEDLRLADMNVTLVGVRRPGAGHFEYGPDTCLGAGDILLLRGEPDALAAAEIMLGEG